MRGSPHPTLQLEHQFFLSCKNITGFDLSAKLSSVIRNSHPQNRIWLVRKKLASYLQSLLKINSRPRNPVQGKNSEHLHATLTGANQVITSILCPPFFSGKTSDKLTDLETEKMGSHDHRSTTKGQFVVSSTIIITNISFLSLTSAEKLTSSSELNSGTSSSSSISLSGQFSSSDSEKQNDHSCVQ